MAERIGKRGVSVSLVNNTEGAGIGGYSRQNIYRYTDPEK